MSILFPESGMAVNEIRQKLLEAQRTFRGYTGSIFWSYSTIPHPLAVEAFQVFSRLNPNNIGTHTRVSSVFLSGARALEKEVILMLGDLMGSADIDGYITQGGTEGNIAGLWIGRNMLRGCGISRKKICLLKTSLTHYSIDKAVDLLGIEKVVDVPLNNAFGMDIAELTKTLEKLVKEGCEGFLIVLTLGYNTTGTIDPVDEIDAVVRGVEEKFGVKTYVHLDAAIGGLVHPFVSEKPFDFRYASIQSISLDMHKTGFVPHTAGAFLCRKGLQKWIERPAPYLPYTKDDTLSGSRPGTSAVAAWSVFHTLGRRGFKEIVQHELELKEYFLALLDEYKEKLAPRIITHQYINIAAVHFGALPDHHLNPITAKKYGMRPIPLQDLDGKEKQFYIIIFMPHITRVAVDRFVQEISQI